MNIPMSHYRSAPPSPRVAMTHADAKPPAYLARLQQHVALGLSPAQAMQAIEAADGHSARLPKSRDESNSGGKGITRDKPGHLRLAVLAMMSREWRKIDPAMIEALDRSDKAIRDALCDLRKAGKVEHSRSKVGSPSMWRLV